MSLLDYTITKVILDPMSVFYSVDMLQKSLAIPECDPQLFLYNSGYV